MHDCDQELKKYKNGWALSGYRQEGDKWKCSCGKVYIHVCDESDGCYWTLAKKQRFLIDK